MVNLINKRSSKQDTITKIITSFFAILFVVLFLMMISFIIYGSIDGWKSYGFLKIFATGKYDLINNHASIWLPMLVSLLVSGLGLLIAAPLGIKTAIFIKFRIPKKIKKYIKMLIEFLSNIPAILFGLFAIATLGPFFQKIFHMPTSYNLLNCSILLSFMIVPTIISLTLSALDSVDLNFINSSILLGSNKTNTIYKIYKKEIRSKIIVALIVAFSRAIGETTAVSMLLQSQNYNQVFNSNFLNVWMSYLKTLCGLIASNMFAEMATSQLQGLMFIYAIFLLIFIIFLNGIIKFLFRQKKYQSNFLIFSKIKYVFIYLISYIETGFQKLFFRNKTYINLQQKTASFKTIYFKNQNIIDQKNKIYSYWKIFWEIFCFSIVISFILWITFDLLKNGFIGITAPSQTIFKIGKDTTGQAIINTLLLIFFTIGIGFFISFNVAILINEFMVNGKAKKSFLFFIDSLGATPTIIFGMFGLILFLQILSLSSAGPSGKSLLAGCLTLVFVILPSLTRTIVQALQVVPNQVRESSYALGVGKFKTMLNLVLPIASQHILSGIVLAIGRIITETASLYLTAGIGGGNKINMLSSGQTLTTRIFTQVNSNNICVAKNIMYECAFIVFIMIVLLLLTLDIIIPKVFKHDKSNIINKIKKIKLFFKK